MANAKISLFFFLRKQCALKTKQNVFLEKKNSTKNRKRKNEADDRKEKKKILGETKFESSDNCLWFFKPEIQKSIFIRV